MDEKVQEEEASLKRLEEQYSKIMKVLDEQLQWLNKELEDLQQDADKRAKVRLHLSDLKHFVAPLEEAFERENEAVHKCIPAHYSTLVKFL